MKLFQFEAFANFYYSFPLFWAVTQQRKTGNHELKFTFQSGFFHKSIWQSINKERDSFTERKLGNFAKSENVISRKSQLIAQVKHNILVAISLSFFFFFFLFLFSFYFLLTYSNRNEKKEKKKKKRTSNQNSLTSLRIFFFFF